MGLKCNQIALQCFEISCLSAETQSNSTTVLWNFLFVSWNPIEQYYSALKFPVCELKPNQTVLQCFEISCLWAETQSNSTTVLWNFLSVSCIGVTSEMRAEGSWVTAKLAVDRQYWCFSGNTGSFLATLVFLWQRWHFSGNIGVSLATLAFFFSDNTGD